MVWGTSLLRTLTEATLGRVYRFLLRRAVGRFLQDDLLLGQVQVSLQSREGLVDVLDVALDAREINDAVLGPLHAPCRVVSASVRRLRARLAYADLLTEGCTVECEGLEINVAPVNTMGEDEEDDGGGVAATSAAAAAAAAAATAAAATAGAPMSTPAPRSAAAAVDAHVAGVGQTGNIAGDAARDDDEEEEDAEEATTFIATWIEEVIAALKIRVVDIVINIVDSAVHPTGGVRLRLEEGAFYNSDPELRARAQTGPTSAATASSSSSEGTAASHLASSVNFVTTAISHKACEVQGLTVESLRFRHEQQSATVGAAESSTRAKAAQKPQGNERSSSTDDTDAASDSDGSDTDGVQDDADDQNLDKVNVEEEEAGAEPSSGTDRVMGVRVNSEAILAVDPGSQLKLRMTNAGTLRAVPTVDMDANVKQIRLSLLPEQLHSLLTVVSAILAGAEAATKADENPVAYMATQRMPAATQRALEWLESLERDAAAASSARTSGSAAAAAAAAAGQHRLNFQRLANLIRQYEDAQQRLLDPPEQHLYQSEMMTSALAGDPTQSLYMSMVDPGGEHTHEMVESEYEDDNDDAIDDDGGDDGAAQADGGSELFHSTIDHHHNHHHHHQQQPHSIITNNNHNNSNHSHKRQRRRRRREQQVQLPQQQRSALELDHSVVGFASALEGSVLRQSPGPATPAAAPPVGPKQPKANVRLRLSVRRVEAGLVLLPRHSGAQPFATGVTRALRLSVQDFVLSFIRERSTTTLDLTALQIALNEESGPERLVRGLAAGAPDTTVADIVTALNGGGFIVPQQPQHQHRPEGDDHQQKQQQQRKKHPQRGHSPPRRHQQPSGHDSLVKVVPIVHFRRDCVNAGDNADHSHGLDNAEYGGNGAGATGAGRRAADHRIRAADLEVNMAFVDQSSSTATRRHQQGAFGGSSLRESRAAHIAAQAQMQEQAWEQHGQFSTVAAFADSTHPAGAVGPSAGMTIRVMCGNLHVVAAPDIVGRWAQAIVGALPTVGAYESSGKVRLSMECPLVRIFLADMAALQPTQSVADRARMNLDPAAWYDDGFDRAAAAAASARGRDPFADPEPRHFRVAPDDGERVRGDRARPGRGRARSPRYGVPATAADTEWLESRWHTRSNARPRRDVASGAPRHGPHDWLAKSCPDIAGMLVELLDLRVTVQAVDPEQQQQEEEELRAREKAQEEEDKRAGRKRSRKKRGKRAHVRSKALAASCHELSAQLVWPQPRPAALRMGTDGKSSSPTPEMGRGGMQYVRVLLARSQGQERVSVTLPTAEHMRRLFRHAGASNKSWESAGGGSSGGSGPASSNHTAAGASVTTTEPGAEGAVGDGDAMSYNRDPDLEISQDSATCVEIRTPILFADMLRCEYAALMTVIDAIVAAAAAHAHETKAVAKSLHASTKKRIPKTPRVQEAVYALVARQARWTIHHDGVHTLPWDERAFLNDGTNANAIGVPPCVSASDCATRSYTFGLDQLRVGIAINSETGMQVAVRATDFAAYESPATPGVAVRQTCTRRLPDSMFAFPVLFKTMFAESHAASNQELRNNVDAMGGVGSRAYQHGASGATSAALSMHFALKPVTPQNTQDVILHFTLDGVTLHYVTVSPWLMDMVELVTPPDPPRIALNKRRKKEAQEKREQRQQRSWRPQQAQRRQDYGAHGDAEAVDEEHDNDDASQAPAIRLQQLPSEASTMSRQTSGGSTVSSNSSSSSSAVTDPTAAAANAAAAAAATAQAKVVVITKTYFTLRDGLIEYVAAGRTPKQREGAATRTLISIDLLRFSGNFVNGAHRQLLRISCRGLMLLLSNRVDLRALDDAGFPQHSPARLPLFGRSWMQPYRPPDVLPASHDAFLETNGFVQIATLSVIDATVGLSGLEDAVHELDRLESARDAAGDWASRSRAIPSLVEVSMGVLHIYCCRDSLAAMVRTATAWTDEFQHATVQTAAYTGRDQEGNDKERRRGRNAADAADTAVGGGEKDQGAWPLGEAPGNAATSLAKRRRHQGPVAARKVQQVQFSSIFDTIDDDTFAPPEPSPAHDKHLLDASRSTVDERAAAENDTDSDRSRRTTARLTTTSHRRSSSNKDGEEQERYYHRDRDHPSAARARTLAGATTRVLLPAGLAAVANAALAVGGSSAAANTAAGGRSGGTESSRVAADLTQALIMDYYGGDVGHTTATATAASASSSVSAAKSDANAADDDGKVFDEDGGEKAANTGGQELDASTGEFVPGVSAPDDIGLGSSARWLPAYDDDNDADEDARTDGGLEPDFGFGEDESEEEDGGETDDQGQAAAANGSVSFLTQSLTSSSGSQSSHSSTPRRDNADKAGEKQFLSFTPWAAPQPLEFELESAGGASATEPEELGKGGADSVAEAWGGSHPLEFELEAAVSAMPGPPDANGLTDARDRDRDSSRDRDRDQRMQVDTIAEMSELSASEVSSAPASESLPSTTAMSAVDDAAASATGSVGEMDASMTTQSIQSSSQISSATTANVPPSSLGQSQTVPQREPVARWFSASGPSNMRVFPQYIGIPSRVSPADEYHGLGTTVDFRSGGGGNVPLGALSVAGGSLPMVRIVLRNLDIKARLFDGKDFAPFDGFRGRGGAASAGAASAASAHTYSHPRSRSRSRDSLDRPHGAHLSEDEASESDDGEDDDDDDVVLGSSTTQRTGASGDGDENGDIVSTNVSALAVLLEDYQPDMLPPADEGGRVVGWQGADGASAATALAQRGHSAARGGRSSRGGSQQRDGRERQRRESRERWRRDTERLIEIHLKGASLSMNMYESVAKRGSVREVFVHPLGYSMILTCAIEDLVVVSIFPGSRPFKALSYWISEQHPRELHRPMVFFQMASMPSSAGADTTEQFAEELRLTLFLLPLRCHLTSPLFRFFQRFFAMEAAVADGAAATGSALVAAQGNASTVDTAVAQHQQRTSGATTDAEDAKAEEEEEEEAADDVVDDDDDDDDTPRQKSVSEPFIQSADVRAVKLKISYHPEAVDLQALSRGNYMEALNLFPIDNMELQLQRVRLTGLTGWERVADNVLRAWVQDLHSNQIHRVLAGTAPLRTIASIGSGVSDLVLLPVQEYQRHGQLMRGVRKGTARFLRTVTQETLHASHKVTQFVADTLNTIADPRGSVAARAGGAGAGRRGAAATAAAAARGGAVVPRGHPPIGHRYDPRMAGMGGAAAAAGDLMLPNPVGGAGPGDVYADQPRGVRESLEHAYGSMQREMNTAVQMIVAVPLQQYERTGSGGYVRSVVQAIPVAVMRPIVGATEAVSTTLLGLRNKVDPERQREEEDMFDV